MKHQAEKVSKGFQSRHHQKAFILQADKWMLRMRGQRPEGS